MTTRHTGRAIVDDVAHRLLITSDAAISWFDEIVVPPLQLADELVSEALDSHIADLLYSACYIHGGPRPISALTNTTPVLSSNADFVRELMASYRGAGGWLPDFEEETESDLTLWGVRYLKPEKYSTDHGRHLPTALPMRSPGYVLFVGEAGPGRPSGRSTRVYWNVTRAGAVELVAHLTEALNLAKEPFQFKIVHSAADWPDRADVAVLYLPVERVAACWDAIVAVFEKIHAEVRPGTPAFTRRMAPGLGIADDPPGGLSYGQTVCRLLSRGLCADHAEHGTASTPATRAEHMLRAAVDGGRTVERMHLNPGADDLDLTRPAAPTPTPRVATVSRTPRHGPVEDRVSAIADSLVRLAVTSGDRCTWLMRRADADSPALETTGSELYDGLPGIALFLAHASAVLGGARYAELAEMAALSTLDHLDRVEHRHGLLGGRAGALAAVVAVGRTLDRPGLRDAGLRPLLSEVDDGPDPSALRHDLIYGVSGTVSAYCWAAREAGSAAVRERLLDRAEDHADVLVADLRHPGDAVVLPGLAHGPSSSVLALSLLSRMRGGTARFDDAAAAAIDHERARFDPATGNWPGGPSGAGESRFNWCYGAPGIALARLAARGHAASATSDLELAARAVREAAPRFLGRSADPSACHGKVSIAGAIDLLGRDPDLGVDVDLGRELLDEALDHHGDDRNVRQAPGLMSGAAGSGLAGLRDRHPDRVPSPLFPLFPFSGEEDHV